MSPLPLTVQVSICFADPIIKSHYRRTYHSSAGFEPSDRICYGLLRRIEHCSNEFMTRKDSRALHPTVHDGSFAQKPTRFEVQYTIVRTGVQGRSDRAERTFRSYQKQPLTVETTREVVFHSHEVISLYLQRHDTGFVMSHHNWEKTAVLSPRMDVPLSPLYAPQLDVLGASRAPGFEPGYTIELSLQGPMSNGATRVFGRMLEIRSLQTAPLTDSVIEDFLEQEAQAIEQLLASQQGMASDAAGPRTSSSGKVPVDITLRVVNNVGPSYNHVQRSIRGNDALSTEAGYRGCDVFIRNADVFLTAARNRLDSELNATRDFEFSVLEVQGWGWTVRKPEELRFRLDSSRSLSRRTIEAATARIETCIRDAIRGQQVSIHFSACSRGHLLLQKSILARERPGKPRELFSGPEQQKLAIVSRLGHGIRKNLEMVCKDTCSIDDIDEHAPFMQHQTSDVDSVGRSKQKESWPQTAVTTEPDSCQETRPLSSSTARRAFPLINGPRRFSLVTDGVKRKDPQLSRPAELTPTCENRTPRPTPTSRPLTSSGLLWGSTGHQPTPKSTSHEVKMDEMEAGSRKSRTPLFISATLKAAKRSLTRGKRKSRREDDLSSPTLASSSAPSSMMSSSGRPSTGLTSTRDSAILNKSLVSKESCVEGHVQGGAQQEAVIKRAEKSEQDVLPLEGFLLYCAADEDDVEENVENNVEEPDAGCTMIPPRTLAFEDESWMAPFIVRRSTNARSTQTQDIGNLQEDSPDAQNMDVSILSDDSQLSQQNQMDCSMVTVGSDGVSTAPSTPGLSVDNDSSPRDSLVGPMFSQSPECAATIMATDRGSHDFDDEVQEAWKMDIATRDSESFESHRGEGESVTMPMFTARAEPSTPRPTSKADEDKGDSASETMVMGTMSSNSPGVGTTEGTEVPGQQAINHELTSVTSPRSVPNSELPSATSKGHGLHTSASKPTQRPCSDDWFAVLETGGPETKGPAPADIGSVKEDRAGVAAPLPDTASNMEYSSFISAARMKALRNPSLKQSLQSLSSPASIPSMSDAASVYNGRDSVDTVTHALSANDSRHEADDDADGPLAPCCPSTAGRLGLRESPLGTLTCSRKRFSMPAQAMLGLSEPIVSRPSSSGTMSKKSVWSKEGRGRRAKSTSDALETPPSSRPGSSAGDVLPRVMVLGAVVAVAARFLQKGY